MNKVFAKDIMDVGSPSVRIGCSLNRVKQLMFTNLLTVIPVLESNQNKMVGVVSDLALMDSLLKAPSLMSWKNIKVEEVMERQIIYCGPSSLIADLTKTFLNSQTECIAVLSDEQNQYVGIIHRWKLFHEFIDRGLEEETSSKTQMNL